MPWLCIKCKRRVIKTSKALECESCKEWMHIRCGIDITPLQYNQVTAGTLDFHWTCQDCASQQIAGRSAADYTAVLEKILEKIPGRPSVIMSDFEAALHSSVLQLLPTTEHKGCCFHWCQAVWRKVQQLGLAVTYQEDVAVNKFIRRIFSLPFIPAPSIEPIVRGILSLDTPATPMAAPIKELVQYVRTTWVDSQQWPPSSWSVFQRSVRTNNDCEGYHRRINSKIRRDHLPFYQLVDLLHTEASLVSIHAQFVADDKLKRDQRSRYQNLYCEKILIVHKYQYIM